MIHKELEVIEKKDGQFFFQLLDNEDKLVLKSILFQSLHDCHSAILKVKMAVANTHLSTTNVKQES